jgi:hypothetical protein
MLTIILYQSVEFRVLLSYSLPIFQDTGIPPGECFDMSRVRVFDCPVFPQRYYNLARQP